MARTLGAKNKPKLASIKLSDLVAKLNGNTDVPVSIDFAKHILGVGQELNTIQKWTAPPVAPATEDTQVEVKPTVVVEDAPTNPIPTTDTGLNDN